MSARFLLESKPFSLAESLSPALDSRILQPIYIQTLSAMADDIKLPLNTPNPADELLAHLHKAAPQIFSEGKIDLDKLKAALGDALDPRIERYGLNWAGKAEAFRNVQQASVGTLLPMPDESVDWDSTGNLIIEGDNLEVLKLLQKPYHGKVKMIYIEVPPVFRLPRDGFHATSFSPC